MHEAGRLDVVLARVPDIGSRSKIARLIKEGRVLLNGENPAKPGIAVKPGDQVVIQLDEPEAPVSSAYEGPEIKLAYQDQQFVIAIKPRGLATHPAPTLNEPTLVDALQAQGIGLSGGEQGRPGIVHRLDKETTGLIAVACTPEAHASLAGQFRIKSAERRYLAVCARRPEHQRFTVDAPIGRDPRHPLRFATREDGKPSVSHFKVLHGSEPSLLACRLETGRTHQIRVHLRACSLPILGDPLYGEPEDDQPLQLHAAMLAVDHPLSGKRITAWCDPPADFALASLADRTELEQW